MAYLTEVWKAGNSFVVTIPPTQMDYFGISKGDKVEVFLKKRRDD
jgi:antitoxin component of MazEF toxin-antitoxin module